MKPDFTLKLLEWNLNFNHRSMPWKGEKDPYRIWLSEIILQQTRVEQGLKYYNTFVSEFPTVAHLATADESRVFKLWEGLGYYSRCRNLIESARYIHHELNDNFPSTFSEILKLKGVGSYTASAIASFAFNEPHAVVDGNVLRVLSRYFGISTPIDTITGRKLYQELAEALLCRENPGIYNQAIMDFGATICKPKLPMCHSCCQREDCQAFKQKCVLNLPVKGKAAIKKHRYFHYFIIECNGSLLVQQRTSKDIWQNLHEFILVESAAEMKNAEVQTFLQKLLNTNLPVTVSASKKYRQVLSHQVINGIFYSARLNPGAVPPAGFMLVSKSDIKNIAFPKIINTHLAEVGLSDL